jgi:hypothetical protein
VFDAIPLILVSCGYRQRGFALRTDQGAVPMSFQSAAATAESLSWFYWLIPVGLVIVGLVWWNWPKVKAAFTAALPDAPKIDLPPVDASLDQIGALKNGFALLLELDRYAPKSLSPAERDKLLLDGVERLLKARSEASK